MAIIDLFSGFLKEIEQDAIAAVGVSLVKNKKVVTARTIKSVRAVTIVNSGDNAARISVFGGEGIPYIMTDKPANTRYPVDFKGVTNGKKVFELKPRLKEWAKVVNFEGSDFQLARAIAEKPRKGIDLSIDAIEYLNKTVTPKILNKFRSLIASEIYKDFNNG